MKSLKCDKCCGKVACSSCRRHMTPHWRFLTITKQKQPKLGWMRFSVATLESVHPQLQPTQVTVFFMRKHDGSPSFWCRTETDWQLQTLYRGKACQPENFFFTLSFYHISELFIASVHHPALTKLTFKILCLSHHCLIVCLLHRHCMKTVLWQNFTPRCKSLSNIVCFHLSLLCELCTVPQLPYQKWVGMDEIFDFC